MQFNFACFKCIYHIYDRNFSLRYPKSSESIRVLGTDRKSTMMIRVKVDSYIRQKFRTSLSKKIGFNMCFEDG